MTDPATIREVCSRLDPANDGHWTSQGLPRMDVLAGMGLTIERRALNDALPGFCRSKLAAERAPAADEPALALVVAEPEMTDAQRSHKHTLARAARRAEALAYLHAGGYTVADLAPVASRLDQRIAARNRQARRELS